jgi:hypothetical protein
MAGPETSSEVRRCPSCGSRNRGNGQWCTLCHTDLTGPPVPTIAESLAELESDQEAGDAAEPVAEHQAFGAARPTGEVDPQLMKQLLLQLEAQESGVRLPGRLSGLSGLIRPGAPRSAMIGLAFGATVVVALLILTVLALVGLAL